MSLSADPVSVKIPSMDLSFLDEVARDLPIIRPIKEFIHLNLLLPYQHLEFWEALQQVSLKLEAMPLPDLKYFREKIQSGELPLSTIEKKLSHLDSAEKEKVLNFVLKDDFNFVHHDVRVGALHEEWNKLLGLNVIQLADGMLIKWLGIYMDQGISHWQMPGAEEKSFYTCVRELLLSSYIKPHPFRYSQIEDLFPEDPAAAIQKHLQILCPDAERQKQYCSEAILTLRGWAGIIYSLQKNPELLSFPRQVTLTGFLAVKLILERAWIDQENFLHQTPDVTQVDQKLSHPLSDPLLFLAFKTCQQSLEEVSYQKVLQGISGQAMKPRPDAKYQAIFCMDDRESELRHFLEEASSEIETLGTAGHYGIEALYQHSYDAFPKKQCPAPMQPKYLLHDVVTDKTHRKGKGISHHLMQPSENLLVEFILSFLDAARSFVQLAGNLFFPLAFKNLENVREVSPDAELKLHRGNIIPMEGHLKEGYSTEEMADVVFSQLKVIGWVHHFAPLCFIIGHGSTSANNPYFASYGCGACSGRPGSANARALSQMANNPEVRALVQSKYGLLIPKETYFVAGFHDTCRDLVQFFNTDQMPEFHKAGFARFKKYLSVALYKNARKRSKLFKLVSYKAISKQAQKEVLRRSYSLFETRPELGHTNVAFSIVGRRETTKGMHIKKPAFLQSYDPTIDPEGNLLAASLGAVIPVTSGINLDYFFSRVDNRRFGAGSKLPQNIVGNFGVSHGTESDLLVGLPFQMIDQHQPLRLLVLVEQKPAIALKAIQGNPLVKQIVYNNWIYYMAYDYETHEFYLFRDGEMQKHDLGAWA